jgi:hypothetical protein
MRTVKNVVQMSDFTDVNNAIEREMGLTDSIKELEKVNKQLARLSLRKEELTNSIVTALGHQHEGQRSYQHEVWKVEIKTPFVYSLNKKLYESGNIKLPADFNPIKESVSYSVDKALCDKYLVDAPKKVRDALIELIDKKPGKASVTIKERC